jgi:ABC-type sugar transport system substrate-binding protein
MRVLLPLSVALLGVTGCSTPAGSGGKDKPRTIAVAFETLQTEYWGASFDALKAELAKRGITMVSAIADGDPNRQLEQVNNFLARRVDGVIAVPKDAGSAVPLIRAANKANVPIVLYNRPPAPNDGRSVAVVADNRAITKATVRFLCDEAKKSGRKHKAMILLGDLADQNAVGRRDGFEDAVQEFPDVVEVVARIPTEWNQEKALAGATNALQANPDIGLVFTSSDFLFPALVSALKAAGKYKKAGEDGHVLLGGFDGDKTAYQMLVDGYLDADGVQDVEFECAAAVDAVLKMRAGETVEPIIRDEGFVIHRGNLEQAKERMWGAKLAAK